MKVFVSADSEGVAGITSSDEARKGQAGYAPFRSQMDAEVAAACEGALTADGVRTVAVSEGIGSSTTSLHPRTAVERIRVEADAALRDPLSAAPAVEGPHRLEVVFKDPSAAYVRSFYPGAGQVDDCTVGVDADDDFDVLRALIFLVGL